LKCCVCRRRRLQNIDELGIEGLKGDRPVPPLLLYMASLKTNVYIDGFNLYYRLLKPNPSLKWLDLDR